MFWRYAVSDNAQEWVAESFSWAIANGLLRRDTPLVVPTTEFFKAPKCEQHETAVALVKDLKRVLGLTDHAIEVAPLEVLPEEQRHQYCQLSAAAGTW